MAGTSNPESARNVSVEDVLTAASRLAVPTDSKDDALATLRAAAADLAAEFDLDVVLYDRSDETWMDHPHPVGPLERDEIDVEERAYLVEQVDEFVARGIPTTAWLATVPSLAEIVDVIREVDVDVILVPDDGDGSRFVDRLKSGGPAEIVERVATLNLEQPVAVLVRRNDGSISVAESADR